MKQFLLFLFCVILCSCSSLDYPEVKKVEAAEDKLNTYSVTSDLRLVHVVTKNGKQWILTEPAPDAAFSYQSSEDLSLSLVSTGKDSEDVKSEAADLPMTGRAAYVVFSREMLFRLNEMAFNTGMSAADYQANYLKTLDVIKAVALVEAAKIEQQHNVTVGDTVTPIPVKK